jgi:hypothetical protein
MHAGKLVFAQLTEFLPLTTFRRCVARYGGEHKIKRFTCLEQFLCLAFAQLTYRESLRDIEACLRAHREKLYHMGIRSRISRSTLADANEVRDWRIYADFAQRLIGMARKLYAEDSFGVDLKETVYALDTTTIDLCLSVFPWAPFRRAKAAVKLHTLLDLRGNIPVFIHISDGKMHEVNILDQLAPQPGAFYIVDRGFLDFERLFRSRSRQFLCYKGKGQPEGAAALFPSSGSLHRVDLRPDDRAYGVLFAQRLSDPVAANPFQGSPDRQTADLPDKQLCLAGLDNRRPVSMPLAGGALF